ncbi:hypothetical protein SDC9_48646 [bioreactor metagenome]|uniref:Restriction endonuclease type IV Mrr domain-containing protein n=1 Tax=bioreactor metagenome TaxID=1076179 RepID=A0A644WFW5_9ZZZZ
MEDLLYKYLIYIIIFVALVIYIYGYKKGNKNGIKTEELKKEVELRNYKYELELKTKNEINELQKEHKLKLEELDKREKELNIKIEKMDTLNKLLKNKTINIPWIADLYSKYSTSYDEYISQQLKLKPNPALKGAEEVKRINKEKKELLKKMVLLEFTIKYYESLFPWLEDLTEQEALENTTLPNYNIEEENDYDKARNYLTKEEYIKLSTVEKYQLALDRYLKEPKNKLQIGKMYERYIGYLYEKTGYEVYYQGIIRGFEDLGRDLICKKGDNILVIQCKCWSKRKEIHENAINQLYGTTVKYWIEEKNKTVNRINEQLTFLDDTIKISDFIEDYNKRIINAVFYTSTSLSNTAKEFADALGIKVYENFELSQYPMIKCNINNKTKEKIYHLPFDQQYDRTEINVVGELYVSTVKEAQDLGFRRAKRWLGENSNS